MRACMAASLQRTTGSLRTYWSATMPWMSTYVRDRFMLGMIPCTSGPFQLHFSSPLANVIWSKPMKREMRDGDGGHEFGGKI